MTQQLKIPETTNFLTPDQVNQFIETIPLLPCYKPSTPNIRKPLPMQGLQLYTEILYDGALRSGEARQVTAQDFDIDYLELKLLHTKSGWRWCKCAVTKRYQHSNRKYLVSFDESCTKCKGTGKKRIPQFTTLSPTSMKHVKEYIEDSHFKKIDWLFKSPSFPKQPIQYDWIYKRFVECGHICDFKIFARYEIRRTKHVYTHIFRKSKAQQMDLDGFRVGVISAKLRHADIQITLDYLKADLEDVKRVEGERYGWYI